MEDGEPVGKRGRPNLPPVPRLWSPSDVVKFLQGIACESVWGTDTTVTKKSSGRTQEVADPSSSVGTADGPALLKLAANRRNRRHLQVVSGQVEDRLAEALEAALTYSRDMESSLDRVLASRLPPTFGGTVQALSRLRARMLGMLWGMLVGDALSTPTDHCFHLGGSDDAARTGTVHSPFPTVTGYAAPQSTGARSMMYDAWQQNPHSTRNIVGVVLNQDRAHAWKVPHAHPHEGLNAGENSLNGAILRLVMRGITARGGHYDPGGFTGEYINFMTTPGSYRDTWVEPSHVEFFHRYTRQISPCDCAGAEHPAACSVEMLSGVLLVALAGLGDLAAGRRENVHERVRAHIRVTHRAERLQHFGVLLVDALWCLLRDGDLRSTVGVLGRRLGYDFEGIAKMSLAQGKEDWEVITPHFGVGTQVEQALPTVLYLATGYARVDEALLANANVGGNTCHRGLLLGALVGAANGINAIPSDLIDGVEEYRDIRHETEQFVQTVLSVIEQPTG